MIQIPKKSKYISRKVRISMSPTRRMPNSRVGSRPRMISLITPPNSISRKDSKAAIRNISDQPPQGRINDFLACPPPGGSIAGPVSSLISSMISLSFSITLSFSVQYT